MTLLNKTKWNEKTFMAESFSEKGGLLSQMLACKGQVLGIQPNSPVLEFMSYIMHVFQGRKV